MNLAPRSTSSPLLRHSSGKWVREGNIQLLQGQETLGLRPRKFGGKFGGKFGAESEEFRSTSPTFSRPTSEIYWPRHRGPRQAFSTGSPPHLEKEDISMRARHQVVFPLLRE